MSQPTSNSTPAQPAFTDLPEVIRDMLRDEANLSTARHVLEDASNDALARADKLRSERPKLSFLVSKKQREEFDAANDAIQRQISLLDNMLNRVAKARDRLQSPLRATLLVHMQQADPLYRQGLRAGRFHEHWLRGHSIVADRLRGFMRDLKTVRTALTNDVGRGLLTLSEESNWAITTLHGASIELDREIDKLNHWGVEHTNCVQGTPFSRVRLPALENWDCTSRTISLSKSTPTAALAAVEALLTEFSEYRQPSLDTLSGMFQAAADEHGQIAETRLRQRWSQLLNYAECHLVADAELEPTLTAIEQRLNSAEHARLTAQLPFTPFTSER
jgi:hypothetical protein